MRTLAGSVALSGSILLLSGCVGSTLNQVTKRDSVLISAAPLCEQVPGNVFSPSGECVPGTPLPADRSATARPNAQLIARLVNESEFYCGAFVNRLVLSSIGVNTNLDLATTVLSALSTAFTPLATVHALTAATTITSGWKTAIDSDLFAQASIANYAQAIDATYYSDMNGYVTKLAAVVDDTTLVWPIELTKINSIHKECALASAQAAIHNALQPADGASTTAGAGSNSSAPASAGSASAGAAGAGSASPPLVSPGKAAANVRSLVPLAATAGVARPPAATSGVTPGHAPGR